jgi:hypothetical protein
MPTALGGKGGGVTTDEEYILWFKNRLENFPTLPDLSLPVSTSSGEELEEGEEEQKVKESVRKCCRKF